MVGSDAPAHQRLRDHVEREWVPRMISILSIDRDSLPVIWDADFLHGPKTPSGEDTYVLCEINVSAVWPFPPMAADTVAAAAVARTRAFRRGRDPVNG
jgi:3-deoxy-D-arabino-heptulosonate 7-phosphate (DAHP) synthase class II